MSNRLTEPSAKSESTNEGSQPVSNRQSKLTSEARLINSQIFTIEMAVNYLFQWRHRKELIKILLQRFVKFPRQDVLRYIPTITFIMSVVPDQIYESFAQHLATESLSLYLALRWSYCTFTLPSKEDNDLRKSKLDSCLLKKFKSYSDVTNQSFSEEDFHRKLQQKLAISNYTSIVNQFFERLFKIPEKLKKYQKPKRMAKLKDYLQTIEEKFMMEHKSMEHKNSKIGLAGIIFPLKGQSLMVMRILKDYCFPFSTKERIPFKLVVETISIEDAAKYQNGKFKQLKKQLFQKQESPRKQKNNLILPHTYFGDQWKETKQKIASQSPFKICPSYKIKTFMVKSGDDLRQEYMAMQLIKLMQEIFEKENLKLWLKSYAVIPYSYDSGLIEFVDDTRTVSFLKEASGSTSLKQIYKQIFGDNWESSIINFTQSLAGYSLIQYLFQVKDRHNNNILIDTDGHLIHIDFSFIISSSPGNMSFERAPFKLTQDYIEIMDGPESDIFQHYRMLFFLGLKYVRKYKKDIMELVMMMSNCEGMKCFRKFDRSQMEKRFHENATDEQLDVIVDEILKQAWSSYSTGNYDRYQWYTNFIYS